MSLELDEHRKLRRLLKLFLLALPLIPYPQQSGPAEPTMPDHLAIT